MKLVTKKIAQDFARQGSVREKAIQDIKIIAKFFNPGGSGTWYAVEFDPETGIFYGYVTDLGFNELGSFALAELEEFRGRFGLGIERDMYFGNNHTLHEVLNGARP